MTKDYWLWGGVAFIALALSIGCKNPPEPEKPFVLTLQLAKRTWHVGESPWYLLQVKNVGSKKRFIDPFWFDQSNFHADYRSKYGIKGRDTYLEVRDSQGRMIVPGCMDDWGMHGEFRFWTNEKADPKCMPLAPGKTFTAAASIVAPVRRQAEARGAVGPADARIPPDASPEARKAYSQLWEQYKKELEQLGKANDFTLNPKVLYPGYRVLECYRLSKPGIYRMKAIMDKTWDPTALSADEQLEQSRRRLGREPTKEFRDEVRKEWEAKTPQELERKRRSRARQDRWMKEDPGFYLESNTVEVEVVP